MKLITPKDCDNAPKRRILRDLNIAFAKADVKKLREFFHPDIEWEMVGNKTITRLDGVVVFLESINKDYKATALEIKQIITHGKYGASSGVLTFKNVKIVFHDFYEFASVGSDKIKKITSMAISLKRGPKPIC